MGFRLSRISGGWCRRLELLAMAGIFFTVPSIGMGDGFRIETKIFVGDEEEPVSETTTLFLGGVVYDFLAKPEQVAVFRKSNGGKPGRFILLDRKARIRTELSTDQVAGAMGKLRTWAARQKDPFLQFAAHPQFKETFKDGQLVLASHLENYTVDTTPAEQAQGLEEYREFLDWYTQLNTLLTHGPPPGPRLKLNDALARHQVFPLKVELTRDGDDEPLRAEHEFIWRLSREDVDRIDDVREWLAAYRQVENEEFLTHTKAGNASR
jgi:hypothetical protein